MALPRSTQNNTTLGNTTTTPNTIKTARNEGSMSRKHAVITPSNTTAAQAILISDALAVGLGLGKRVDFIDRRLKPNRGHILLGEQRLVTEPASKT
jgi:hypothetical protein